MYPRALLDNGNDRSAKGQGMKYVLRVRLDNGADFRVAGLQSTSMLTGQSADGFAFLNSYGHPISFVYATEIVSITVESE